MANLFNGVKISLLMQQSNRDYSYVAFPTFDTTVNNYEDDATEINQCYISGTCPVSHGIDFNGETILRVDDLTNSDYIINTGRENITKLKYGDFGINVYTEESGFFYNLRKEEDKKIKNENITYVGYVNNIKKELKLQNLSFWLVVPQNNNSDFILRHVPLFKAEKGTFTITEKHYFSDSSNPSNVSNVLVKFEVGGNEIEFIFLFKYELDLIITENNYNFNFAGFLYKIKDVKFNNKECECELNTTDNGNKVTYTSDGNIILLYTVKHNLPNSDTESYTSKDGYSYCHEDHIFKFVLYNNNVSCCVDYCQMLFARNTNLILPKTTSSTSTDDYFVKSTKKEGDKLIVSLNDSNKNYTFEEGETPLYNFYDFCNHWNSYYMYRPIDQLTFLKQGNYKFKCYNVLDEEVPGNILLLPCNHNLCIYDKNKTITSGYTINLESNIDNIDTWTSRETKISNLEKEIEKYYTLYDYIKNNIGKESLSPEKLEDRIKDIYEHITTDDIYKNKYRDYRSDFNLVYYPSEEDSSGNNIIDLVKENLFKSCMLYKTSDTTYLGTLSIKIDDTYYILKISYSEGGELLASIKPELSESSLFILVSQTQNINFVNSSELYSYISTYFTSVDEEMPYFIDISSLYIDLDYMLCLQLTLSQFLINKNTIKEYFSNQEEGEGSEGGESELVTINRRRLVTLSYLVDFGGTNGTGLILKPLNFAEHTEKISIQAADNVLHKLDCTYSVLMYSFLLFRCYISFSDYENNSDGLGKRTEVSFALNSSSLNANSNGWFESLIEVITTHYKASNVYSPENVVITSKQPIKWKHVEDNGSHTFYLIMTANINVGEKQTITVEKSSNARSMSNISRTTTADEVDLIEYIPSNSSLQLTKKADYNYLSEQTYRSGGVVRTIYISNSNANFWFDVESNSKLYSYYLGYEFGSDHNKMVNQHIADVKYKINNDSDYTSLGTRPINITKFVYDNDIGLCEIGYEKIALPEEKFSTSGDFLFPPDTIGAIGITQAESTDIYNGVKNFTYEGTEHQIAVTFNTKTYDTTIVLDDEFIYKFIYPTISEGEDIDSFNGQTTAALYFNNQYERFIGNVSITLKQSTIVDNKKFLGVYQIYIPTLEGFTFDYTPVVPEGPIIPSVPENDVINQPELDVPLEYDTVETEADLVKILSQAFEYRIKELKQSKSSLTDGLYYSLLKNLDESIDPENDWIGEIRFIPDDPLYLDDTKRINEKPLTLSVIYVDELNLFNQIQYYNSKNEYVLCNTTSNFYLGSKESNLETFIKNGVNLSFKAIYKSPYYVECKTQDTISYHLYPILQTGQVTGETINFTRIDGSKYNLHITDNNKLLFKYIAGVCQEDLLGDDASITVAMYVCNSGGNYTVNERFTKEVNKERSVDITEQNAIGSSYTTDNDSDNVKVPLLPTFLYRSGNDDLAKSTSSANGYSITIPESPSINSIDYNLATMSLGHIQGEKVYPGSIWNKNLKLWTGDYLSVLTNLYKAYKCKQSREYVSNYAYYKNYSTVYSKDVLVSINPRNVDDCNKYLTIRDFDYVEWLELLNKYRKNKNNKDSNVNIRVLGTMKNFPLVFNFNYKLPIIDVSLPEAEKNAVHTIYGTNSDTVVSVDTSTLYTLDSNGDPIIATAYPYVPKCEYNKFELSSNNTKIVYKGSKPEQTLNITELLIDNSLKLSGNYLLLNSFSNSGKYDVLTTLRRNWIGKKYNEYLTGLPKNQGFIE